MTTADRRLAAMEAALSPTERVVRWLAEAHAFGTFETWAKASFAAGPDGLPLDRLAREAAEAVRGGRRQGSPETEAAVRQAVLGTVFRVELVLRIIDVSGTALRMETFILAALSAYVALTLETAAERPASATRLGAQRDSLFERVAELHALEAARTIVEARYLDGRRALFPDAVAAWAEQVHRSEAMAVMALRIAEIDGAPPLDEARYGVTDEARVAACVADLVEAAKIKALDELGDGRAAVSRAIRWLRPKLGEGSTL